MRRRVWISPFSGISLAAVDRGPVFRWCRGIRRYIYRDIDGICRGIVLAWPGPSYVVSRDDA